jgi:hypothetical protein
MIGTNRATTITLAGQRPAGLIERLTTWILAPAAIASDGGDAVSPTGLELHGRPADRIAGADGSWSQGRWARLA